MSRNAVACLSQLGDSDWSVMSDLNSRPACEPFRIEDNDALAVKTQPAARGEVGQGLVDGLPGGPDELSQLLLGQIVGNSKHATVPRPETAGHLQKVLRDPAGDVGEDQIRERVVGAAQTPGEHAQKL